MIATARVMADEVVAKVRLPANACGLLDVGGGHGLAFDLASATLSCTQLCLIYPSAETCAGNTITCEGIANWVTVQPSDYSGVMLLSDS